jgi:2-isopropylmalate synthase
MSQQPTAVPAPDADRKTSNTDRVFIFDTTLRDGEQCPGATMTFEEKLEVADFLDAMGVDIIEAGFPIASDGDFQAVSEIAKRLKRSVVAGLCRAGEADIDRAGEAVRHAKRPRIHTFLSTSPVHRKHKLQKSAEQVLEMIQFQVSRARGWVEDVEWSAEDATRTEIDYLCRCVETAIKAGASTINLPDTVGYATPDEYYQMFRTVMEKVPGSEKVIFSVHCHNDLGMAVANSLAGVRAGCRQVECTINGIGERAGNAALEEIGRAAMRCPTRSASMPPCSTAPPSWWPPRPRSRCSTTRPSSDGMRSRTSRASIRTACSSTPRPTRS